MQSFHQQALGNQDTTMFSVQEARESICQHLTYDESYENCPFMVHYQKQDPHNFISFDVTEGTYKGRALKAPPDYRMPVRGETYNFTCHLPNFYQTEVTPQQYMKT